MRAGNGHWSIGTDYGYVRRARAGNDARWGLTTRRGFHCEKGDVIMTWGPLRLLTQSEADNLPPAWDGYVTEWEKNTCVIPDIPVEDIAHFGPCLINSASTEAGETRNVRMERDVEFATIEVVADREIKGDEPLLLQYGGKYDNDLSKFRAELEAARMEKIESRKGVHPSKSRRCKKCSQWVSKKRFLQHYTSHLE
jgi:hypothetical protein